MLGGVDRKFVAFLILAQLLCCLSLTILIQRLVQLLGGTPKIYLLEFNFPANVAFSLIPLKALIPLQI